MGVHFVQGKGEVLAIRSQTVKCFGFVCENLTTFPFGKRIVGKLDSWAFWRYIYFQDQRWGLWEISKKVTIVLRKLKPTQQGCGRNMHIHEWTPRRTGPPRTTRTAFRLRMLVTVRSDAALFPNYFWADLFSLQYIQYIQYIVADSALARLFSAIVFQSVLSICLYAKCICVVNLPATAHTFYFCSGFRRPRDLMANIFWMKQDLDNRLRVYESTRGPLCRLKM